MENILNKNTFKYPDNVSLVAGVDEVGRGPLIGAVVTAAVILDPNNPVKGLNDSKKLTDKKRRLLADEIKHRALAWSLGRAEANEIDQINILQATIVAMQRAVVNLEIKPNWIFVDGNNIPQFNIPTQAVIKGDSLVSEISAASILAKVARDDEMLVLDRRYPEYGFAKHKGYPTKLHLEKLEELGVLAEHRRSFSPIKKCIENK